MTDTANSNSISKAVGLPDLKQLKEKFDGKPLEPNPIDPKKIDPALATWMTANGSTLSKMKLRDICLPGTHDSGTYLYEKDPLIALYIRTQRADILTQLELGCRWFDIRIEWDKKNNNWQIYHQGINWLPDKWFYCGAADSVFEDFNTFLGRGSASGEALFIKLTVNNLASSHAPHPNYADLQNYLLSYIPRSQIIRSITDQGLATAKLNLGIMDFGAVIKKGRVAIILTDQISPHSMPDPSLYFAEEDLFPKTNYNSHEADGLPTPWWIINSGLAEAAAARKEFPNELLSVGMVADASLKPLHLGTPFYYARRTNEEFAKNNLYGKWTKSKPSMNFINLDYAGYAGLLGTFSNDVTRNLINLTPGISI